VFHCVEAGHSVAGVAVAWQCRWPAQSLRFRLRRVPTGSGRIRFHDPRGEHKILRHVYGKKAPPRYAHAIPNEMPPIAPFHSPYAVEVSGGLLLLFPSWLVHEVEDNTGIDSSDNGFVLTISPHTHLLFQPPLHPLMFFGVCVRALSVLTLHVYGLLSVRAVQVSHLVCVQPRW
jgi:hypothetical protein